MLRRSGTGVAAIAAILFCAGVEADAQSATGAATAGPAVIVRTSSERIRFTAPSSVVQMKVEIVSGAGVSVFDVTTRGTVFDWSMKSGDGEAVADGNYVCVVTLKSVNGKLSQRAGTVSFVSGRADIKPGVRLTPAQEGTIGPIEDASAISIMGDDLPSTTVVGHDGKAGQVTATTGDLTFRTGDVFSGTETERMRITADGKIGIGTDHPEMELDVRGTLRASEGYRFMNGSKLTMDGKGTLKVTRADGTESPMVAGTGTQNRVAKWMETGGAGTLGDSSITDTGTNVGIGITTPQYPLHIVSPTFGQLYVSGGSAADFLMFHTGAPVNTRWTGLRSQGGFGKISSFNDIGTYRVENILTWNNANGFVGVGIASPQYPIHIDNPTFGQLYVSGGTAADFLMYHTNGPVNAKWTGLRSQGGFGKISSFNDNGTYRNESILVWDNALGNVGIGTSTPGSRLDVAGNISTSSDYQIRGQTVLRVDQLGRGSTMIGLNAGSLGETNGNGANSFFGFNAGRNAIAATNNAFFGIDSGLDSSIGSYNAFFGSSSGKNNGYGNSNAFFGANAGLNNKGTFEGSSGNNNSFFGFDAGQTNTSGQFNTAFGYSADFSAIDLTNATAIGANAQATASNSLVLGSINGVNSATADTSVGIGVTAPAFKLHVVDPSNTGLRVQTNTAGGTVASFGGNGAFRIDAPGSLGGRFVVRENGNIGIGNPNPNAKLDVSGGSIYIHNPNTLVITSPNGACWGITVNNAGVVSSFATTCP